MLQSSELIREFRLLIVCLLGFGLAFMPKNIAPDTIGDFTLQDRGSHATVAMHVLIHPGATLTMSPRGSFRECPYVQLLEDRF